jgi:hypothetical protein
MTSEIFLGKFEISTKKMQKDKKFIFLSHLLLNDFGNRHS